MGDAQESTAEDGSGILSYEDYVDRGIKAKRMIDTNPPTDKVIRNPGDPPREIAHMATECAHIDDGYTIRIVGDWFYFEEGGQYQEDEMRHFTDPAVSLPTATEFIETTCLANSAGRKLCAKSMYNVELGVITTDSRYTDYPKKNRESEVENPTLRNHPSEIIWQIWKEMAGSEVSRLRFHISHSVDNEGTQFVIKTAYDRQRPPLDTLSKGDFSFDVKEPEKRKAFLALLGTANVLPTEYMLIDHFNAAGKKKVQRILVFPFKTAVGKLSWNLVMVIGEDP